MQNHSNYWLIPPKGEDMSTIEMASVQSAISNFVRILTKKNIPIIVEPEGEHYVRRVLNYLNPSQKEKALKNIKFTN